MSEHQKYEYQPIFFTGDLFAGLNKAGQDGWMFCSILEQHDGSDPTKKAGTGCLMMRPVRLIVTDLSGAPPLRPRGE